MIQVIAAKYLTDYKIYITFNDQKAGIIDLKETIFNDHRPIFNSLTDLNKFKNFRVAMDTIIWDNGLDLAPEFLYSKI